MNMDELTKRKEFQPSNNQLKYLEVYKNQENGDSKKAIAERAGITFKTLWEWEKDQEFINWIADEVDKTVKRYTPAIKVKILEKALSDKATVQERELALRVANEYTPTTKTITDNMNYEEIIQKVLDKAKELIEA